MTPSVRAAEQTSLLPPHPIKLNGLSYAPACSTQCCSLLSTAVVKCARNRTCGTWGKVLTRHSKDGRGNFQICYVFQQIQSHGCPWVGWQRENTCTGNIPCEDKRGDHKQIKTRRQNRSTKPVKGVVKFQKSTNNQKYVIKMGR